MLNNLAGLAFLMLLPILFGAMAVFLTFFFQFFIIRLRNFFFDSDIDYRELYE